jgi:hypothetical protein
MTSQSPRIYVYKITFEEVPYYYYGVHKEKRFNEEYWGSPVTNKWCWEFYTPKKQMLELFDFNDEGWVKAQEVEKRLIMQFYNSDEFCLNASCAGKTSIVVCSRNGNKTFAEKKGIFALTAKERSELSKKNAKQNNENGKGFLSLTKDELKEAGKKGGDKCYNENIGIFSLSDDERKDLSRRIGQKAYEEKTGIHALAPEKLQELGKNLAKKINSQVWECTVTGHRSNPGGLSTYQKFRNIDTSNRIRIK